MNEETKRLRKKAFRECFLLFSVLAILALSVGPYFYFMPYPWWVCRMARNDTFFQAKWPVSEANYAAARRVVKRKLMFYEFLSEVHFGGPAEIYFISITTFISGDPPYLAGRCFKLVKNGNTWSIEGVSLWDSHMQRLLFWTPATNSPSA